MGFQSQQNSSRSLNSLRVLMQMRENALTQRGGDTVVMEQITSWLRSQGHTVDVDLRLERSPSDYDIVHLYNFATPQITQFQAQQCVEANTPYVVTTMYEDWPYFFHRMWELGFALMKYVELRQPQNSWEEVRQNSQKIPPSEKQDNTFAATHAAALIPTGEFEKRILLRDYPQAKMVEIYRCGCEVSAKVDNGDLFRKEYGLSDFVLCVGRLENRKNQAMLLKAMEESDLPLVFACGGFTYQPEYEALCHDFKRRGKTLFLGKLEAEMLASAFAAARVHALPSWFELPGLVNIEAAHFGTNIVVTDYGTIRDYVGDDAFYCKPDDEQSILNAVMAAYYAPRRPGLPERVKEFTWANAAKRNLEIYEKVLTKFGYTKEALGTGDFAADRNHGYALKGIDTAASTVSAARETVARLTTQLSTPPGWNAEADALCIDGDKLALSGRAEEALPKYREAARIAPQFARPLRGLGILALSQSNWDEAETCLNKALAIDPDDTRAKAGLGTAYWSQGRKEAGFDLLAEALESEPTNQFAILQFMAACYEGNRLDRLEQVLRRYLEHDPKNDGMEFCLAGCLYKREKFREARRLVDAILAADPQHANALELRRLLSSVSAEPAGEDLWRPEPPPFNEKVAALEARQQKKCYDEVLAETTQLLQATSMTVEERVIFTILRAEALACKGDFPGAGKLFQEAEASSHYLFRAIAGRGIVAVAENRWTDAEEHFESALQLNPGHDVSWAGLGLCAMKRGEREQAWKHYQRSLEHNPENHRALLGLVELAYPMKRLPELETALVNYLSHCPAHLSILYAYAGCVYAQGKVDLAVEQLEKIRLFDPAHELANELYEKILSERGQARANASS